MKMEMKHSSFQKLIIVMTSSEESEMELGSMMKSRGAGLLLIQPTGGLSHRPIGMYSPPPMTASTPLGSVRCANSLSSQAKWLLPSAIHNNSGI
mmetsp:Transcript_3932/g.5519  ORF Transcript_3932/g.5519 Transcript_3932/m.5519 type:complete len:94 (-) Transcript_3932:86-367(-)